MSKSKNTARFRSWCFTLNNFEDSDHVWLSEVQAVYMVYGEEIAPTTGTPHLQGYVYLANGKTESAARKSFPRCHLAVAKGTAKQNREYCTKEGGKIVERGTIPSQGERSDLMEVKKIVDEGGNLLRCFEEQFPTTVKYTKNIEKYIALKVPKRDSPPEVYWRWGDTGLGKTRWVWETFGNANVFNKPTKAEWYNGYEQQQVCLIDDFKAGRLDDKELLRLLDRYPMQVEIKGGYVEFNSPIIVITCDSPPERFWSGKDLEQIMRRLTHVVHVTEQ